MESVPTDETIFVADARQDYLDECEAANLRDATRETKGCTIGQFTAWLMTQGVTRMEDVTSKICTHFLIWFKTSPKKNGGGEKRSEISVQCAARIIKTWLGWAYRKGYIDRHVWANFIVPKADNVSVYMATITDVKTIFRISDDFWTLDKHPDIKWWPERSHRFFRYRTKAVVAVEVSVGLRGGELLEVRLQDYDRVAKSIIVRKTKGRKERVVPVSPVLAEVLDDWLKVRPKKAPTDYLIVTETGGKMSRVGITRQFKRLLDWGRTNGYPDLPEITMHSLRHQALNAMLQVSPAHAKKLGGHTTLKALERYEHTVDPGVQKTHEIVDPLAQVVTRRKPQSRGVKMF
jgi:integrase